MVLYRTLVEPFQDKELTWFCMEPSRFFSQPAGTFGSKAMVITRRLMGEINSNSAWVSHESGSRSRFITNLFGLIYSSYICEHLGRPSCDDLRDYVRTVTHFPVNASSCLGVYMNARMFDGVNNKQS